MINPPPPAVGAGNVDVDEDDDNAADMENNAGEDMDKVNAPVDMEEEDGEYVGDDEDGGQGRRQPLLLTFTERLFRVNGPCFVIFVISLSSCKKYP